MRGLVPAVAAAVLAAALALGCRASAPPAPAGVLVFEEEAPAAQPPAPPPVAKPVAEGSDWSEAELPRPEPDRCRDLCLRDDLCRAFTYVGPGLDGPRARCLLKQKQ
jgi:PAN domain